MDQFVELPLASFALALAPWIFIPAAVAAAWAGVTRRSGLAALFLGVAVLAVVGPVFLAFAEARVRDADELTNTEWMVADIDGDPVPDGEVYLFIDAESASLVTGGKSSRAYSTHIQSAEPVWQVSNRSALQCRHSAV